MQETLTSKLAPFWREIDAMRGRGESWKAVARWLAERGIECKLSALRARHSARKPRRKLYAPSIASLAAFLPHMYGYSVEQAVRRCGKELADMRENGCTWESMAMALRLQGVMASSHQIAVAMLRTRAWKQPDMSIEGLDVPTNALRSCEEEARARAAGGLRACLPMVSRLRAAGASWKDVSRLLSRAGLDVSESWLRAAAAKKGCGEKGAMDDSAVAACAERVRAWMDEAGVEPPMSRPKAVCMSMSGAIAALRRGGVSWKDISRILALCGVHADAQNIRVNFS